VNQQLLNALTGSKEMLQVLVNLFSKRLLLTLLVGWFLAELVQTTKNELLALAAIAGLVLLALSYILAESWTSVSQAQATAHACGEEAKRPVILQPPPAPLPTTPYTGAPPT